MGIRAALALQVEQEAVGCEQIECLLCIPIDVALFLRALVDFDAHPIGLCRDGMAAASDCAYFLIRAGLGCLVVPARARVLDIVVDGSRLHWNDYVYHNAFSMRARMA